MSVMRQLFFSQSHLNLMKSPNELHTADQPASSQVIQQLQKILKYGKFVESPILRRFLIYIVKETLEGRAANLKEYSIAVAVLKKSTNFSPKMNGIVRVHARRLRVTLQNYYESFGKEDACVISVPKGRYVPVFHGLKQADPNVKEEAILSRMPGCTKKINILLLPLKTFDSDFLKYILADHFRLFLTKEMEAVPGLQLVSHNNSIAQNHNGSRYAQPQPDFIVKGTVYFEAKKFRFVIDLIEVPGLNEIWSEEFKITYDMGMYSRQLSVILSRMLPFILNQADDVMQGKYKLAVP